MDLGIVKRKEIFVWKRRGACFLQAVGTIRKKKSVSTREKEGFLIKARATNSSAEKWAVRQVGGQSLKQEKTPLGKKSWKSKNRQKRGGGRVARYIPAFCQLPGGDGGKKGRAWRFCSKGVFFPTQNKKSNGRKKLERENFPTICHVKGCKLWKREHLSLFEY